MKGLWMALLLALAGGAMAEDAYKGYEAPPYAVERAEGGVELRRYQPYLVAEVTVEGERSAAIGRGFRVLAGYIFGANEGDEKIAMTVPVVQTSEGAGRWTVRFMMPRGKDAGALPRPKDGRIRFVTVPGGRQAVVTFSGLPMTGDMERRAEALRTWIAARGLTVTDGPHFQFYDSPMTLPWRRRNEVAFGVE